jgi:DNA-directed RNA polymerase specialized sigma24 family protein
LSVADPTEPVRTRAEIAAAIRALSPAQWARLRKVAGYYALGRLMEAEDLLQEGFRRALDGRKCPASVDIVRFLAEAMRSIRDGELKRAKRRPVLVSAPPPEGAPAQEPDAIDPALNAEERLAAADEDGAGERKRQEIIGLFADDLAAQVIVEGTLEGTRGEDLRALTDLDPTAYQSKRRLIRRRIEKAIQGMKK